MVLLRLSLALGLACLIVMTLVDRALGSRAEFLNAWSVVERLLGRPPSAPASVVASHLGSLGELCVVIAANLALGFLLALSAPDGNSWVLQELPRRP